jgi:hypothetical protein
MDYGKEILNLVNSSAGKAAPYMTQKLKEIGNGSMAEGISAMMDYSVKCGMEMGERGGIKKGFGLGVCTMGVLCFATKIWGDFRKYKMEKIESLQVIERRMKNADTKQSDEESALCERDSKHEDRAEVKI